MSRFSRLAVAVLAGVAMLNLGQSATAQIVVQAGQAGQSAVRASWTGFPAIPGYSMLQTEAARKELKLSDEQKEKLQEIGKKYYEQMRGAWSGFGELSAEERKKKLEEYRRLSAERMEAVRKQVQEVLSPDQLNVLKKLNLRTRGPYLLRSPRILDQLQATEQQKQQIRKLQQQLQERIRRLQKRSFEKTLELLTPEQRKQLEEIGARGYGAMVLPAGTQKNK